MSRASGALEARFFYMEIIDKIMMLFGYFMFGYHLPDFWEAIRAFFNLK